MLFFAADFHGISLPLSISIYRIFQRIISCNNKPPNKGYIKQNQLFACDNRLELIPYVQFLTAAVIKEGKPDF